MKFFLILFGLIFFCIAVSKAQTPLANGNITNNSLNKFIGTWQWTGGTDTLTIVLKKENVLLPFPENSRVDLIIGFHKYKKANMVVESSLEFSQTNYTDKHSTILGGNDNGNNTLSATIRDISKNKLSSLTLTLNTSENQLQWNLKNREGLKLGYFDYNFTLPQVLNLIKQ